MTDKERLLALLADFGITPTSDAEFYAENALVLEAQKGGVRGYDSFFCRFGFDAEGKFTDVGVWE